MPLLVCSIALLAVTVIYLFWRSYLLAFERRQDVLRERVALLLWTAADAEQDSDDVRNAALDNSAKKF